MKMTTPSFTPRTILGVGAHADDVDFCAAGTVARMVEEGAKAFYLVLTDGSKGSSDRSADPSALATRRREEQRAAAKALGVSEVFFLDYEDGRLEVTMDLKRDIARVIRQVQPDTVIAFDPTMVYSVEAGLINHPDHRAAGQALLDAVYPLARDHLSFPELLAEGLQPHKVSTVLLTNYNERNFFVDVTTTFEKKIQALSSHVSQKMDLEQLQAAATTHARAMGELAGCDFAEEFVRIDVPA